MLFGWWRAMLSPCTHLLTNWWLGGGWGVKPMLGGGFPAPGSIWNMGSNSVGDKRRPGDESLERRGGIHSIVCGRLRG